MSINKVGLVILVVLVVAVLFSVFSGSFKEVVGGFADSVTYPDVKPE